MKRGKRSNIKLYEDYLGISKEELDEVLKPFMKYYSTTPDNFCEIYVSSSSKLKLKLLKMRSNLLIAYLTIKNNVKRRVINK